MQTLVLCFLPLVFATPVYASSQDHSSTFTGGDWVYVDHDLGGTRYSRAGLDHGALCFSARLRIHSAPGSAVKSASSASANADEATIPN